MPNLAQHELTARDDRWELSFWHDPCPLLQLYGECLGRMVLVTNRAVGSAATVAAVHGQLQHTERVVSVAERARLAALERGLPRDRAAM